MKNKANNNEPFIAVIVLGYNDRNNLKDTMDSVLNQSYTNYKTIYIDNASTDNSFEFVRENYPQIQLIRNKKNLGYAGAYKKILDELFNNRPKSKVFEAIVLLNSDVVVDYNWLRELSISAFSSRKIALAQPKIFLYRNNKKTDLINTFGNNINYLGFGFCGNYKKRDLPKIKNDKEIVYASGCSLLIKKDAYLNSSGGLDNKFFAYLEDQDLGWRLQMNNYKIILSAKSIMWHKYIFQRNERNKWKFYMLERNRLFFIFKNYQTKTIILLLPIFLFIEIGVVLDSLTKGYFTDKIKGYVDFIKSIKILKKDRNKIQRKRKLSDRQLFDKFSPTIEFEEVDNFLLKITNLFLLAYYKIIKLFI